MISPTDKLRDGWWDRKEMEKKLQEQVTTLIRLTEMIPPSSVAELYAITIPNLITFMHKEITFALLSERTRLEGLLPREVALDDELTEEEKSLMVKIFGTTKTPEYMRERRHGFNSAIREVRKLLGNETVQ